MSGRALLAAAARGVICDAVGWGSDACCVAMGLGAYTMAGKFDASMTCANTSGTAVVDCGLREQLPESSVLAALGLQAVDGIAAVTSCCCCVVDDNLAVTSYCFDGCWSPMMTGVPDAVCAVLCSTRQPIVIGDVNTEGFGNVNIDCSGSTCLAVPHWLLLLLLLLLL